MFFAYVRFGIIYFQNVIKSHIICKSPSSNFGESKMIIVDERMKAALLERGISILRVPPIGYPGDCIFEPPCSLKWMDIQYRSRVGAFSYAVSGYYFNVEIGRYVSIGEEVQIGRGSHPIHWASTSPVFYGPHQDVVDFTIEAARDYKTDTPYIHPKPAIIGNDVYIGHRALIMPGVRIGNGAIVGAQSVVTKDVPDYAIVAGAPATIRKMRFSDKIIEQFAKCQWWDYAFWDLKPFNVVDPERFIDGVNNLVDQGLQKYQPDSVYLAEFRVSE